MPRSIKPYTWAARQGIEGVHVLVRGRNVFMNGCRVLVITGNRRSHHRLGRIGEKYGLVRPDGSAVVEPVFAWFADAVTEAHKALLFGFYSGVDGRPLLRRSALPHHPHDGMIVRAERDLSPGHLTPCVRAGGVYVLRGPDHWFLAPDHGVISAALRTEEVRQYLKDGTLEETGLSKRLSSDDLIPGGVSSGEPSLALVNGRAENQLPSTPDSPGNTG